MKSEIPQDWREELCEEFSKPYFESLTSFVDSQYAAGGVFPARSMLFNALAQTPFESVKVVIVGQDPYHDVGQAHGLCFSVGRGVRIPPSLQNIFKELHSDLGIEPSADGDLTSWAKQGVLLLNSVLTVEAHKPASHAKRGWEEFTDAIVGRLAARRTGIVYMLWGKAAQTKCRMVERSTNLVLESVHPSPLSAYRGFLGCGHFSAANDYLTQRAQTPIEWRLPSLTPSLFDVDSQGGYK